MRKIFNKIAVATIATVSFAACTEVDICTSELHPHLATVDISYDWNGVTMSDSMLVMPYRIVNEWGCVYICTPDGSAGHYIDNRPDSVFTNDAGELFTIKTGETRFLTFNYNPANVAYAYINVLSSKALMNNLVKVRYKSYSLESSVMKQYYGNDFISADTTKNNYVLNGNLFPHVYSQYTGIIDVENGSNKIEFAPKSIFNNYEFNFDISAEGVTVNKVLASLSGVPYSYNMTSCKPETSRVCNVLFGVAGNGGSKYTGTATVLGLQRSSDSTISRGPGCLQLAIYVTDAEGNNKVYNLLINLYNYIPGIDRLQYGKDCTYNIDAPIVITNDGVETSKGAASWKLLNLSL